jgi:hypothetical protein
MRLKQVPFLPEGNKDRLKCRSATENWQFYNIFLIPNGFRIDAAHASDRQTFMWLF